MNYLFDTYYHEHQALRRVSQLEAAGYFAFCVKTPGQDEWIVTYKHNDLVKSELTLENI